MTDTPEYALMTKMIERLQDTTDKIAEDVVDVRERVTRLEQNDQLRLKSLTRIQWAIGLTIPTVIAGIPVLFLIWDRISN